MSQPKLTFAHNCATTYSSTITRYVGPTTVSGGRGTLPQPSPTDVNTVYLAPNGNDLSAGTAAAPKLTLTGAAAILNATKSTIQIIRNGYVGDMIFTFTGTTNINGAAGTTTINIQVENGEVAYLRATNNAGQLVFNPTGGAGVITLNGLYIQGLEGNGTSLVSGSTNATALVYQNCYSEFLVDSAVSYLADTGITTNHYVSSAYSVFMVRQSGIRCSMHSSMSHTNSIFVMLGNSGSTGMVDIEAILTPVDNANSQSVTVTRCLFYFAPNIRGWAWRDLNTQTVGLAHTLTFASCDFHGCEYITSLASSGTNTYYFNLVLNYCLNTADAPEITTGTTTTDTGLVATITNEIDPATPELFTNETGGLAGDPSGFRLQIAGKSTGSGNGKYLLTSPLVDAGLAGVDVNPWDESVTGPTITFPTTTVLNRPPKTGERRRKAENLTNATDVTGDLKKIYDSLRRAYTFDWGDAYESNDDLWKLELILADTGSMRMYRQGLTGTEYPNATLADFNATTNIVTPTKIDATIEMIPHKWIGFWVVIDTKHLIITENDEDTFTVYDLLGTGYPSTGTGYSFSVPYQLVKSIIDVISGNTQYYRGDQGQQEGELAPGATAPFEWQSSRLEVVEVRSIDPDRSSGRY